MKTPETINEILDYFKGLTFHGVDVSLALGNHFTSTYMFGRARAKYRWDWMYRLAGAKPIFFERVRRRSSLVMPVIPRADYLLVTTGAVRSDLLLLPVLEQLGSSSRLIFYTALRSPVKTNGISSVSLQNIPFSFDEWSNATSEMWKKVQRQLAVFKRDFELNNFEVYGILSKLCVAIETVLKAESLFDIVKPKVVFTEADFHGHHAIFLQVARKMGIASASMVHGIRGGDRFHASSGLI